MIMKIWELYFLRQFTKIFLLFLSCFYGLYILIDYANRSSTFAHQQVNIDWQEVVRYYFYVFSSRAEILIPLALLIAFVQTTYSLNTHHELIALMAGGFSLKTLMRPFIFIGLMCTFLMYANEQFLLPTALTRLRYIEDAAKDKKSRKTTKLAAHHLILENGSLFIYQNYDTTTKRFFDVYWIESVDSIYRIKFLTPFRQPPQGNYVDHLVRQSNGEILQQGAYPELTFPEMKFQSNLLQTTLIDTDMLSPTELFTESFDIPSEPNEKESKVLTSLYWKLVLPWLCLLAILAPAPYCVRFSRYLPIFLIYVCSVFGLIAFYMFMDAAQVIAKKQVIPPFLAICIPFLMTFMYFGYCFRKLKSTGS